MSLQLRRYVSYYNIIKGQVLLSADMFLLQAETEVARLDAEATDDWACGGLPIWDYAATLGFKLKFWGASGFGLQHLLDRVWCLYLWPN